MIENIDDDRIELKGRVEEALKVLMRQMLVQKNGSVYVFLTDEEQEVNNEIEKENVETPEIITKVAEMIFEDIFPASATPIRYSTGAMLSDSTSLWMTAPIRQIRTTTLASAF